MVDPFLAPCLRIWLFSGLDLTSWQNVCLATLTEVVECSGVRRKFPRGGKVSSQINFRGSAEGTTILRGPGACSQVNFAKLHLKIRIFVHSASKF